MVNLAAVHRDDVRDKSEYQRTKVDGAENVALVCEEKGIDILIDAVEQAVNNPEFQAVDAGQPMLVHIIGIQEEGPYLEQIKSTLLERPDLPIVLHDPVAPEELKKYYQAADFFLLPSRSEGFNVSLLEACSSGLPIVATKVGGNHLVVRSHHTGKLVEANDADAFANGGGSCFCTGPPV